MSLLEIEDLSVSFGPVRALDRVSVRVGRGEIVAIVGSNGAGKSTLMRTIMGLTRPQSGRVLLDGASIAGRRTDQIARAGIAYVQEGRGVLRQLTIRENLLLGAFGRAWDDAAKADLEAVQQRFPILAERMSQRAGTLSGGEQQMLVIARALMARPRLLLLDEPSLGLAPLVVQRIFEIIAEIAAAGVTILLVEQNAHAALRLAQRAYVLETGRIMLEGADLVSDPRVQEAFLGGTGV